MQPDNSPNTGKSGTVPERFQAGWLDALDGRLSLARDMRDRFATVCNDLGGADRLSYMQRSLVERCLWSEYWIAQQERELAKGNEVDMGRYTQAVNALSGLYNRLGLERRARDVPDLKSYLAAKAAEKAEAADG